MVCWTKGHKSRVPVLELLFLSEWPPMPQSSNSRVNILTYRWYFLATIICSLYSEIITNSDITFQENTYISITLVYPLTANPTPCIIKLYETDSHSTHVALASYISVSVQP